MKQSLSYSEIGCRVGKDKSWAQRRHKLVTDLSQELQNAVRQSKISTWSAERVLTPLARAKAPHATQLIDTLSETPMSTRELTAWFKHYQQANQGQRDLMVKTPGLFIKTLQQPQDASEANDLEQGIDGRWLNQVERMSSQLSYLTREAPKVFGESQSNSQQHLLIKAYERFAKQFQIFKNKVHEVTHARSQNRGDHQAVTQQRNLNPTDQPAVEDLTKQRSASVEEPRAQKADPEVAARYLQAVRSLLQDPG